MAAAQINISGAPCHDDQVSSCWHLTSAALHCLCQAMIAVMSCSTELPCHSRAWHSFRWCKAGASLRRRDQNVLVCVKERLLLRCLTPHRLLGAAEGCQAACAGSGQGRWPPAGRPWALAGAPQANGEPVHTPTPHSLSSITGARPSAMRHVSCSQATPALSADRQLA